jgi:hypothetical protein
LDALLTANGSGRLAVDTSVQAKEQDAARARPADGSAKPLLLVDIDGVISLFGFAPGTGSAPGIGGSWAGHESAGARPEGSFHAIDGIPHFLSATAARHLLALVSSFELVWASGWEEKADEYLPHLLGLPSGLAHLSFAREVGGRSGARAHWKIEAIDAYAGGERALAWVDDAFDDTCHAWADARTAPTLLVRTVPHVGFTEREASRLRAFARSAQPAAQPAGPLTSAGRLSATDCTRRTGSDAIAGTQQCPGPRYSPSCESSSGISSSASSSTKPGSASPAPIFSSEARSASNSCP